MQDYVIPFTALGMHDVPKVGGKNASLGEMVSHLARVGVSVPGGFATTAQAFTDFLSQSGLRQHIMAQLDSLDVDDVDKLVEVGRKIRQSVVDTPFQPEFTAAIAEAYQALIGDHPGDISVAVRSSATAEDLPDASFAGQQETFLNVRGLDNVLLAIKHVFASLFNDRAIAYRVHQGFAHHEVALSAGIQKMVRSDVGASGVMFTLDTESGFRDVVFLTSSYGLGEMVVQGAVNPDEFYVHKPTLRAGRPAILRRNRGSKLIKMIYSPDQTHGRSTQIVDIDVAEQQVFSLSDADVMDLARQALLIEEHYGRPMDIEWGKDGIDGKIYILQARPETVKSRITQTNTVERFHIQKGNAAVLTTGRSIGQRIGAGPARVISSLSQMSQVQKGDVLVTDMTDPDWEPVMKRASAIVTNRGGRTCFAGDTQILTNQGFKRLADIYEHGYDGLTTPALNRQSLKMEWKPITDVMKRRAPLIKINVSQTGRMQGNGLKLTPNHKMLNLRAAELVDTEIQDMLAAEESVLLARHIPQLSASTDKQRSLAYLLGGIMSDGHIYLNRTHGEITFIQKPTEQKQAFIQRMNQALEENFGGVFKTTVKNTSQGLIRGQLVIGNANAYRYYSKASAQILQQEQADIVTSLLKHDVELAANFLAGLIDGDGCFQQGRVNLYVSNEQTLQAVIVACLRLGTAPQVSVNRTIYNVQIVEKLDVIGQYTQRVRCFDQRTMGSRFFNTRQLFTTPVNSDINNRCRKNYLLDETRLRTHLSHIQDEALHAKLHQLLHSDLQQIRVQQEAELGEADVYNITVDEHHNYIVFTERYSPVLVNNCHAAIIARELGIPAVVGCGDATDHIADGAPVTVSCAEGDTGYIYEGILPFQMSTSDLAALPELPFKIMMNVGNPERAFDFASIPNAGIGLARLEFIINRMIGIHPKALLNFSQQSPELQAVIKSHIGGYADPVSYYVDRLAEGVSTLAAAFYPQPVIVRLSDFKSNEYANLIGGKQFEPHEENPMIGFRGASRYIAESFRDCFELECRAMKKVRNDMGLTNVELMIPFVRTVDEAAQVIDLLEENGLKRGENGLRIIMMCELPSNALLADDFLQYFDGFSIGSNDMTQLTLGLDRDSGLIAHLFDERNPAVKQLLHLSIQACRRQGKYIGICGQGPSDHPDLAKWLMDEGITSVSLNPDTVISTWLYLAGQAGN
ncbi:phosphoenolpyruvate synthase [Thioflexithrix psekupsensis]|nr:phosphoenolpyruvate synthase [Thioflexithrix psekupsensis]